MDRTSLIYFDHKVPDEFSVPALPGDHKGSVANLQNVLEGAIPNENGLYTRKIPFIHRPDTPYRRK